jgi:hypothetical protein
MTFTPMKRILLSVIVMAFAVAVQAGDAKTKQPKDQDQPACCGSKMKTSTPAKEGTATTEKTCCGCCKQQKATKPVSLMSPKAAANLVQ